MRKTNNNICKLFKTGIISVTLFASAFTSANAIAEEVPTTLEKYLTTTEYDDKNNYDSIVHIKIGEDE